MAHDFLGNELSIGDDVVFLNYNGTSASLERGKITRVSEHTAEISGKRRAEYKIVKVNPVKPTMGNTWIPCSEQNKIRDLKYDAQEREKAVVQLRKKWQDAEMFICTMCGHFDHSTDGNIVYGNKECCEIVGYPYCKKFTPWISASVRLPKELEPVNVVWVNHNPAPYYRYMKDVPQKATAVYYRGAWYWWSCVCEDLLVECGANETDQVDDDVEITHWQPLPELPKEGGAENG